MNIYVIQISLNAISYEMILIPFKEIIMIFVLIAKKSTSKTQSSLFIFVVDNLIIGGGATLLKTLRCTNQLSYNIIDKFIALLVDG